MPARPGCRPGRCPKAPAFGRPRLGCEAGPLPEPSGLRPAQVETRPGDHAREASQSRDWRGRRGDHRLRCTAATTEGNGEVGGCPNGGGAHHRGGEVLDGGGVDGFDGIEVGGATAVVEVAEDGGAEFGLPDPIPWTGRSGATRHSFLSA